MLRLSFAQCRRYTLFICSTTRSILYAGPRIHPQLLKCEWLFIIFSLYQIIVFSLSQVSPDSLSFSSFYPVASLSTLFHALLFPTSFYFSFSRHFFIQLSDSNFTISALSITLFSLIHLYLITQFFFTTFLPNCQSSFTIHLIIYLLSYFPSVLPHYSYFIFLLHSLYYLAHSTFSIYINMYNIYFIYDNSKESDFFKI